ncbi:hypothetical protein [Aeromicrobium sp. UC242_57]|uniref:hypothetical protein n=1 Tax=Aeromicrobium sp. UC242_57 TaxID=3374624 RepID=UPI0037955711
MGIEIEFNLVDGQGDPALKNAEALAAIADPDFQTELGLFDIEINVAPQRIDGAGLEQMQRALRDDLNAAQDKAAKVDTHLLMIGILPTLQDGHFSRDAISANPRYHLLSEQILAARGEDIEIIIDGVDRLQTTADTIIPEAACTSTQLHLQVHPEDFAATWNAAQAMAAVQVAVGANSPFLLGQHLWHETRIALFEQATDTRSEELKAQGVRPRVFFGERWDHVGVRPVRGERPLLPGAAPDRRRRGSCCSASRRGECPPSASFGCTTARCTAGTGRSTTSQADGRTCGSRTACCRPVPRSSTRWQTPPCSTASSRCCGLVNVLSGPSCRSERPRTTSTRRHATVSTPRSTGPVSAPWLCVSRAASAAAAGACRSGADGGRG